MRFYFAPMEGITTYIYRNAHHKHYGGIEKYYAPFVSPGPDQGISMKEAKDVLPEKNQGIPMIPQIMTNRSVDVQLPPHEGKIFASCDVLPVKSLF
jgi:tRNA-dihydrouridine synthase